MIDLYELGVVKFSLRNEYVTSHLPFQIAIASKVAALIVTSSFKMNFYNSSPIIISIKINVGDVKIGQPDETSEYRDQKGRGIHRVSAILSVIAKIVIWILKILPLLIPLNL